MTHATVVRYRTTPEAAEENAQLVRAVYDELGRVAPDGFRYVTFRLEDGVSFVHVAVQEDGSDNPLPTLDAFQQFQAGLPERVVEDPQPSPATIVGSYALPITND